MYITPTPVISGPIALINPIAHQKKKKKKKKKKNLTKTKTHNIVGTQSSNQNIAN